LYLGSSSTLTVILASVQGIWNTTAGSDSKASTVGTVGYGTYPSYGAPQNLFDDSNGTEYYNRGNAYNESNLIAGLNTGFYVTVHDCQSVLTGFSFVLKNDKSNHDPLNVTIEGSNAGDLTKGANWHLLYNGTTGLLNIKGRSGEGFPQNINNSESYLSYRFLITAKRGRSKYVIYAGVNLFGYHG